MVSVFFGGASDLSDQSDLSDSSDLLGLSDLPGLSDWLEALAWCLVGFL